MKTQTFNSKAAMATVGTTLLFLGLGGLHAAKGTLLDADGGGGNEAMRGAAKMWDFSVDGGTDIPFFPWGNSRTGGFGPSTCAKNPGKCIGYGTIVMGGSVGVGGKTIPRITIHAEGDDIQGPLYTRAGRDLDGNNPITVVLQWGWKHGWYGCEDIFVPYIDQLLRMGRPGKSIAIENGWLGDLLSTQGETAEFPTVAPYKEYKGDRSKASWLPNRYMAYVWRAYNARHPTKTKVGHVSEMGRSAMPGLEILRPSRAYYRVQMPPPPVITTDAPQSFEVRSTYTDITTVEIYDGDVKLGELKGNLYGVYQANGVRFGEPKIHSLIAIATRKGGQKVTSRPVLVYVTGSERNVSFLPQSTALVLLPGSQVREGLHQIHSYSAGLPVLSLGNPGARHFRLLDPLGRILPHQ